MALFGTILTLFRVYKLAFVIVAKDMSMIKSKRLLQFLARHSSTKPLSPEVKAKREAYFAFEKGWETKVDYNLLNAKEKLIHLKHKEAIEGLHWTYIDPDTGLKVITRFRHYLKGTCCGNACRHCVYDHEAVPEEIKVNRTFNSAFWINKEDGRL